MDRLKYYGLALVLLCLYLVVDSSLEPSCGKRKGVAQIIGNSDWPWFAEILHKIGQSNVYACAGTILDQNIVLTAAHCVMTSNGVMARERLLVHVGRNRLSVGSNRVQERQALKLIVHPEYRVNSIQHDIALIKLETDITYTDYVQPICLWNRGEDLHAIVGTKGTVVGFGRDETGNVSNTLREASIPVVSHITCIQSNREAFAYHLTSDMFCAGNRDGIGACNGDSGSGLFFKYDDVWYIRGVVSFTKPRQDTLLCDTTEYTIFTDVAKYLRWIERHTRGNGGKTVVKRNAIDSKIELLPVSTCGPNPYADREELSKPVLLGYPWMGLIECSYTYSVKKRTICQAMLISDFYLITSGICGIDTKGCSKPSARLGEYDRNTTTDCTQVNGEMVCSPSIQIIRIESVIMHPDYDMVHFANDIALIRLRDRADTSQRNVKPICLPVTNELRSQKSTRYILTSWNLDKFNKDLKLVLDRSLRDTFELAECQKQYKNSSINITTRYMCTKFNEETCSHGDLSSPLQLVQQVQGESRYVLWGISLLEDNCLFPSATVYTNVASYVDWILENIHE